MLLFVVKVLLHPYWALTLPWHPHMFAVSSAPHTTVFARGRTALRATLCCFHFFDHSRPLFFRLWFKFFTIMPLLHQTVKANCILQSRVDLFRNTPLAKSGRCWKEEHSHSPHINSRHTIFHVNVSGITGAETCLRMKFNTFPCSFVSFLSGLQRFISSGPRRRLANTEEFRHQTRVPFGSTLLSISIHFGPSHLPGIFIFSRFLLHPMIRCLLPSCTPLHMS